MVGMVVYGLLRSLEMTRVTYASLRTYVIERVRPDTVVFSVDGVADWLPRPLDAPSRVLPTPEGNASDVYVHAMEHVLYGLRALGNHSVVIVSRVDVEYASYLSMPAKVASNTITIPTFQNYGHLNDRFCFGQRKTLVSWFSLRLTLAKKRVYGERGACKAAKALKLNVSRTQLKFVRRRGDLFVPDVDKATVWKSIPLRPWMQMHDVSCRH